MQEKWNKSYMKNYVKDAYRLLPCPQITKPFFGV